MNEPDGRSLSLAERAVRDAVGGLARPRADDAFRARLRHEFSTGRIGRRRGLRLERRWFLRGVLLAPVTAGLLVASVLVANRGPDWSVVSADGGGRVVVDGVALAPSDRVGIAAHLARGGHIEIRGAVTLDLVARGVAAVTLSQGADMTLSPSPNRWWRRGMSARLAIGDAYFSTGGRFHGARLDVRTPHATVRAVGTSFAVLCIPEGTCVCVLNGRVRVGGRGAVPGQGVEVPQGMRRIVGADQAAVTLPILDSSVHHLHRQLAAVGSVLGRP